MFEKDKENEEKFYKYVYEAEKNKQRVAELEKENAEMCGELTKAKEIIKKYMRFKPMVGGVQYYHEEYEQEGKTDEILNEYNIDFSGIDFEESLKTITFLNSLIISSRTETLLKLYDSATNESEYDSLIKKLAEEIKANDDVVNREKNAEKIISKKESLKDLFKVHALFETGKQKVKEMTSPDSLDKRFAEAILLLQSKDWKERIQGEMIETDARIVILRNYLKNYEPEDVEYRLNVKRLVHLQDYYKDLAGLTLIEEIELPQGLINLPDGYMHSFGGK